MISRGLLKGAVVQVGDVSTKLRDAEAQTWSGQDAVESTSKAASRSLYDAQETT
jgi:hypothetical protein